MTDLLYVSTGELSSRLLNEEISILEGMRAKLSSFSNTPTYTSDAKSMALYSAGVTDEIRSITTRVNGIIGQLKDFSRILDTGPAAIAAVDSACKSELTSWFDRAQYNTGCFFAEVKTGIENTIDFWVDDYKSKGTSYKIVQSILAVGRAAPAIIGCAASWVAAPISPTTWLSTIYAVNSAASMWADIYNVWNENYDEVGNVDILKECLTEGYGDLSVMLGGDEDVGEVIGNAIYGVGDITTQVTNASATKKINGETVTKTEILEVKDEIKTKAGIGNGSVSDIRSRIIQSDFSFKTLKDGIKEIPDAIKGLWDIASNSPLSEVAKDYKLFSYTIPNILETVSTVELLKEVGDKTSTLMTNGIEFLKVLNK